VVGKGWIAIYGLLLFFAFYLFLSQHDANSRIEQLQSEVAALKASGQATPSPSAEPTPTPDLSTPAARDTQRKSDVNKIKSALTAYRSDKGSYPTELKELTPDRLESLPADPLAPKYSYRYRKTSTGFQLTAVLEQKNDPDDAGDADHKRDQVYTVTDAA
jgi:hypothetical protein